MSAIKICPKLAKTPAVVGTIHSQKALAAARRLRKGAVDLLELRVDHFADNPEPLLRAAHSLPAPLIVTVRHPQEGGFGSLSWKAREELFARFLPVADWIDVELRSIKRLSNSVLAEARACGVGIIVSDHHFRSTPPLSTLVRRLQSARRAAPEVFKIATRTETARELTVLLSFLQKSPRQALAVMGMGAFGKVSRLVLARSGSVLNYGWLGEPQVPGQWEATELKARIEEL